MLAELLVEVGYCGKPALEYNFVYLVFSFTEQVAGFVCTDLVHIVHETAAGAAGKEATEGVGTHLCHGSNLPDRYGTVKVVRNEGAYGCKPAVISVTCSLGAFP